jgi:hypothetical protein
VTSTAPRRKVFGIGFQRTGTTSLVRALELLGINSIHNPAPLLDDLNHPVIHAYEGFADNPLPLIFRELDVRYQGSKFILTDRDVEDWLQSVRWLFTVAPTLGEWGTSQSAIAMHEAVYGVARFDEEVFRARYLQHRADVLAYFARRPEDLLVIDVTRGDAWNELCAFLGQPVPAQPFPRENPKFGPYSATAVSWKLRRLLRKLR